MPDWSKFEEMWKKMEPVRKVFGPLKHQAIPIFEDCQNYLIEQVVALANLSREIEWAEYSEKTVEKSRQFEAMLKALRPVEHPQPRIYLWKEGNMPAETDYTDNSELRYNHDPDFKPYLFEMLLPEDVTPKGAVVFCAGGDHGDAHLPEAYQTALDFHTMGYQCFLLLNRTNHNPWSQREAGVDGARAIRMVRQNADQYRIDPKKVAFAGFSNGGVTGEGIIQYFSGKQTVQAVFPDYIPDALDELDATPAAFLCVYGPRFAGEPFDWENVVYPPTFFAIGREDNAMDNLHATYPDLLAHGVEIEVHTFAGVPHGKAGAVLLDGRVNYPNFQLWLPLADAFLQNVFDR